MNDKHINLSNIENLQVVTNLKSKEIVYPETREMYTSLCTPSNVHAYSLAVEYLKNWFFSKFNKNYFKASFVEGSHPLDDFKKTVTMKALVKKLKPSVNINPQLDIQWDNEKQFSYPFGLNTYIRSTKLDGSFFKDTKKNLYMSMTLDGMQVNCSFRVRVATKAEQIDLYKYMNLAFRIGYTQGEYKDVDYHLPYHLMLQIAKDAGFEINEKKRIVDVLGFVKYLNKHSVVPVLVKFRNINQKEEFFIRVKNNYFHINTTDDLSADDGEREGMLTTNFIIEMSVVLTLPCPKFYMYYSTTKHDTIQKLELEETQLTGLFGVKQTRVADRNNKDWEIYLTTEVIEENLIKPLVIEFMPLFNPTSDIGKVIRYTEDLAISPSIFMDIKVYNAGNEIPYTMDWKTLTLTTKECVENKVSFIVIYADTNYMTERLLEMKAIKNSRIQ